MKKVDYKLTFVQFLDRLVIHLEFRFMSFNTTNNYNSN